MDTQRFIIEVAVPVEATDEQVEEWVRFCVGNRGSIPNSNPLSEHDLECNEVEPTIF